MYKYESTKQEQKEPVCQIGQMVQMSEKICAIIGVKNSEKINVSNSKLLK